MINLAYNIRRYVWHEKKKLLHDELPPGGDEPGKTCVISLNPNAQRAIIQYSTRI
ncbi:hypothetical protein ACFQ3K_09065 [Brucella gallinifaecis]|uniref:hypothetical protein n=1 Tax=Brucella gallinifaecis TaxID=215590 RepID=UPI00130EB79C|nr:hypothetical protein [Brucella gallinifaecis]